MKPVKVLEIQATFPLSGGNGSSAWLNVSDYVTGSIQVTLQNSNGTVIAQVEHSLDGIGAAVMPKTPNYPSGPQGTIPQNASFISDPLNFAATKLVRITRTGGTATQGTATVTVIAKDRT